VPKRFSERKREEKKDLSHDKSDMFPSHMAQVHTCDYTSAREKIALNQATKKILLAAG
jgi:hypothetical protein